MASVAKVHSKSDSTILQARAQKWVQSGQVSFDLPYEEECVSYTLDVKFPFPYKEKPKVYLTVEMEEGNYFGAEAQIAERKPDSFTIALRNCQHEPAKGVVMWRSEL